MRCKDESKVDAIFEATLGLVKERGLAGVTMCDISKAACMATGTLYIYFKNKDELIRALFWVCRDKSAAYYFHGMDPQSSFEERMERLFRNIVDFKMKHFEVSAFLEQSYHSPFVDAVDLKKKQKALGPLFALIREGIETAKLKDRDADLIISFLFGVINELVKKSYLSNKKLTEATIGKVYDMFWDGVKK